MSLRNHVKSGFYRCGEVEVQHVGEVFREEVVYYGSCVGGQQFAFVCTGGFHF